MAPHLKTELTAEASDTSAAQESHAEVRKEEHQYLDLLEHILEHGETRTDRTGTGTRAVFAPPQMRFSLRDGRFPLLTTKRVPFRLVAEELLWFVRGETDALKLAEKKVHIWDGNGSKEFLEKAGLGHRREGDLGPIYGWQWRHFGADYTDCNADYTGKGVDQLADLVKKIRTQPHDRRLILSAWNVADLAQMALPPCHLLAQFYVSDATDTRPATLSCQLYQRSCDMGLGVPFNIASYALLTYMLAHVCDLEPGEFIHTMGDAHIYCDHIDALKEQLARQPREFPQLRIRPRDNNQPIERLEDFTFEDFEVLNYNPHKKIAMKMSV
ncbi:thymidylate synthase [Thamnocephalis sphaerospora]|uniref:thymidylate synthase n=1 Tax=Thamnocephalis sphaerospora TaxID=78915 RepID=A0A4P9XL45_9FUNG|nr:thymidylate synthase [Thamnocephalis sphaerospora]|eukprot:RKP06563.1 thymidylate synthase [Thamnocephalis sphaerospora]